MICAADTIIVVRIIVAQVRSEPRVIVRHVLFSAYVGLVAIVCASRAPTFLHQTCVLVTSRVAHWVGDGFGSDVVWFWGD